MKRQIGEPPYGSAIGVRTFTDGDTRGCPARSNPMTQPQSRPALRLRTCATSRKQPDQPGVARLALDRRPAGARPPPKGRHRSRRGPESPPRKPEYSLATATSPYGMTRRPDGRRPARFRMPHASERHRTRDATQVRPAPVAQISAGPTTNPRRSVPRRRRPSSVEVWRARSNQQPAAGAGGGASPVARPARSGACGRALAQWRALTRRDNRRPRVDRTRTGVVLAGAREGV